MTHAVAADGRVAAAVERKSLPDLVSSPTTGTLRYALAELAALPRAAVIVEDRYSAIFKLDRIRPAKVADGLAELQIRWPNVPIVYGETRSLAEEWTYRYLAAAHHWATAEGAAAGRVGPAVSDLEHRPGSTRTHHRRGPRLGPRQRHRRTRPRQAASRSMAAVARCQPVAVTASQPPALEPAAAGIFSANAGLAVPRWLHDESQAVERSRPHMRSIAASTPVSAGSSVRDLHIGSASARR